MSHTNTAFVKMPCKKPQAREQQWQKESKLSKSKPWKRDNTLAEKRQQYAATF